MLRDISICLSAQQLAKIASKHKLSYVLFTMKILIAFPNALEAQKFAVEKIIKVYLHNYGVLHIITGFFSVVVWFFAIYSCCASAPLPFTQSGLHDLMHLSQDLSSACMSQGTEGTFEMS